MSSEVTRVSAAVRKLLSTADDNKKIIESLENRVKDARDEVRQLRQILGEHRIDIDDIQMKIAVIPEMKDHIHVISNWMDILYWC